MIHYLTVALRDSLSNFKYNHGIERFVFFFNFKIKKNYLPSRLYHSTLIKTGYIFFWNGAVLLNILLITTLTNVSLKWLQSIVFFI